MKCLRYKKIALIFFAVIFASNVFATNNQTVTPTGNHAQCHAQDLHTSPCVIVSIGDNIIEIEQETDITQTLNELATPDFDFISLIEHNTVALTDDYRLYYARDMLPPDTQQLARSHLFFI